MREPRPIEGARALLFEQLVDDRKLSAEERRRLRVLDREALKESVYRELERLLNTRCSTPMHLLGGEEKTVLNYGIPDFSALSPQSADDQRRLASIIGQTIAAFEPRLRQVRVTMERFLNSENALLVRIDAVLAVASIIEPVSFLISSKAGATEVQT